MRSANRLAGHDLKYSQNSCVNAINHWYNIVAHGVKMKTVFRDLNKAFVFSLAALQRDGKLVNSRGTKQKEIINYNICILDPTALSIEPRARKFNPSYATTEWLWYLSQSRSAKNIGKMAGIWKKIADGRDEVESNYGTYIFEQWSWAIQELLLDKDSRRATIAINQPFHKYANPCDYPCTQYLQFLIRDNKLHLIVNMRSNDAVFGFCNDVFAFSLFQQMMLNELNYNNPEGGKALELGHYYHHAGSFHIYESHWPMMDKILNNYYPLYLEKEGSDELPELKKYKLKETVHGFVGRYMLPEEDMTKEQIKEFTQKIAEEIYV